MLLDDLGNSFFRRYKITHLHFLCRLRTHQCPLRQSPQSRPRSHCPGHLQLQVHSRLGSPLDSGSQDGIHPSRDPPLCSTSCQQASTKIEAGHFTSFKFGATVITISTFPGVKSGKTTSSSTVLMSPISISLTLFNILST